jgi:putative ABC transport system permease protein
MSPSIRFALVIALAQGPLAPFARAALAQAGSAPGPVPGIAIERRLAKRFALRVGDTVALTPQPDRPAARYRIEAIHQPRPDPATALRGEYQVRFHLAELSRLLAAPDRVDRIAVLGRPGVPPESTAFRLNQLAFGYRAYPSTEIAAESSRTFAVVSRFHRAIGVISIVASAVFLLCIMLLKVEERRLDAAVMRMIGISRATVFRAFVLEATLVAAVGSGLGVGLAAVAGAVTNLVYRRRFETALVFSHLSAEIVAFGVVVSLLLGVVVGAVAARRLVATPPLALWRRVG